MGAYRSATGRFGGDSLDAALPGPSSTGRVQRRTHEADHGQDLFETGNELPHGPMASAVAILATLVVYPISRLVKMVIRL